MVAQVSSSVAGHVNSQSRLRRCRPSVKDGLTASTANASDEYEKLHMMNKETGDEFPD
jgi:hypothetical protein